MESTWLNTLANWNPQLLREFRGRLKLRSVLASSAVSLVIQMLMVMGLQASLSDLPDTAPPAAIAEKWQGLWETMTWIIPFALIGIGAFFLVNDMAQEERSGTMNFIRSSPRPPYQILIGKLLGVPILPYLAIVLALPLHWYAGIQGGVPPLVIVSFDLMLIAGCILFFCPALLFGLLQNAQQKTIGGQAIGGFAYTAFLVFSLIPLYLNWNFQTTWQPFSRMKENNFWSRSSVDWGFLSLSKDVWLAHGFILINVAIITFFVWQMLLRRFYSHNVSTLGKHLSYALVPYIQILVIGFSLRVKPDSNTTGAISIVLYVVNIFLFISLVFALSPTRQAVLDWLRYRQSHHHAPTSSPSSSLSSAYLWRDLVWADGSPSPIAIALNLLIVNAIVWPWIFLVSGILPETQKTLSVQTPQDGTLLGIILFMVSTALTVLIQATITQRLFISRLRNPAVWAVGILLTWMSVPPIVLNLLRLTNSNSTLNAFLWTLWGSPFYIIGVAADKTGVRTGAIAGLILQVLLLGVLLWQFLQQLERLAATTVRNSDVLTG
jgi:hypothetical protein